MDVSYAIAVTAVIYRKENGRFLITRRVPTKRKFPGKWTVPGGKLDPGDYQNLPKDAGNLWYEVLETTVAREVKEEVGLDIKNVDYLTSIVADYGEEVPHGFIISLIAELSGGELQIQEEELDKAEWVTAKEAEEYDLIDGIQDELWMAEAYLKGERIPWSEIKKD